MKVREFTTPMSNFRPSTKPTDDIEKRIMALSPQEMLQINACAIRAKNLADQYRLGDKKDAVLEASMNVLGLDFALVHVVRNLDLAALCACDNLTFIEEFAQIQKNIVRNPKSFPLAVRLRFARS